MSQQQIIWLVVGGAVFLFVRVAFLQSRIWYLQRMRKRWMATVCDTNDAPQLGNEDMPQLQRVLREARVGIEDVIWPYTQPAGFGFVAQRQMSLINNLCVRNDEVAQTANAKIGEAIGAYRMRRNDTVNPVRWVIWLWTLPTSIAGSLGADEDSKTVRAGQVVYQILVVAGLVLKVYLEWLDRTP